MNFIKIPGFTNYKISSCGLVMNKHNKILKNRTIKGGYQIVKLSLGNGQYKESYVHRLVCKTYLDTIENKNVVDHINHDKTDNRIENLRYVTQKENCMNRLKKESLKYKGVYTVKRNNKPDKYKVIFNKKHIGIFDNEDKAAAAYNEEIIKTGNIYYPLNDIN